MAQIKKQIALDHIKIAIYALELIRVKTEHAEEISEEDVESIEDITAKVKKVKEDLDKLVVWM